VTLPALRVDGKLRHKMKIESWQFLQHVAVELPAAITFFVFPDRQLGVHTPVAHAVIRQYALLLVSSVLIALIFAQRPPDELTGQVAGALAIYHIGPIIRAASKVRRDFWWSVEGFLIVIEPLSYFFIHLSALVTLTELCWTEWLSLSKTSGKALG
jgi:hypothetical protein